MSKFLFKKSLTGLIPVDDDAVDMFNSIKEDEYILIDYKKHRNIGNHRRLFSMLNGVVDNSDHYKNVNELLDVIKLKSGHFTTIVLHSGGVAYVPKSINFASMSEDKFKVFFSNAIDISLQFTSDNDIEDILRYC